MLLFDQLKRSDPQLRLVATVVGLGLGLLLGGLWYVQVVSANRYRAELVDQSFRIVRVPAIRGKILDRNGWALAENRPSYNLDLYLEELRPNFRYEYTNYVLKEFRRQHPKTRPTPQQDELMQTEARVRVVSNLMAHVSTLLEQPQVLQERQFTNHYNNLRSIPFPLMHNLSAQQIALFVENPKQLPSLALEVQPVRRYPRAAAAAHIIGYVKIEDTPGEEEEVSFQFRLPDYVGQSGIEHGFEQYLRGQAGIKSVLVNNLQYRQAEQIWLPPAPGENVVLTLDVPIQQATETALKAAAPEGGAAVVMDCRNGDILAMASAPTFDPNVFTAGHLSEDEWAKLTDEKALPLMNRATYAMYPPGSIFKIIVSLAGLESGILKTNEVFHSHGSYQINGRGHVWKDTAGAGDFVFEKAFYLSSNPYFIDYGLRIGFERIADMGRRFGLGQRTGLSTRQEHSGYFPDPAEKMKKDGSAWMQGDTANLCIGQGDLYVTPLQMAVMTAAVANGGTVLEPRVVDRVEPQDPQTPGEVVRFPPGQIRRHVNLNPENLAIVRNAMMLDVEHRDPVTGKFDGTGKRAAVEGMRVCGKTGTAQVMQGNRLKSYVTWFASFAPFDAPRYVVVVAVEAEHGSGGGTCAPVAHDIYEAILKRERGLPTTKTRSSLAVN